MNTANLSTAWQIAGIIFFSLVAVGAIAMLIILIKSFVNHQKVHRELKKTALKSIYLNELMSFAMVRFNAYLWTYADKKFIFSEDSYKALGLDSAFVSLNREKFPSERAYIDVIIFLNNEVPGTYSIQMFYPFGEVSHWYELCMRITDDNGVITKQGVMVLLDENKKRAAKAQEAHEMLIRATERENSLNIIHQEIGTPTSIIRDYSDVLMTIGESMSDKERQLCCRNVSFCGQILEDLVENIIQLNKIDRGELQVQLEEHNVSELVNVDINSRSRLMLNRKHIEATVDEGNKDVKVNVDINVFKKVMSYLLSNAAKFSPKDSIVRIGWENEARNTVIYVADEGIGIDAEHQDNVFQRFYKVDSKVHGIGIGLSLAKAMVEAMNGKIGVDSQRGMGSRFWISFPIVK